MEKDDLTQRLARLVETKNLVEEHGPNSDTGRAWLAEASAVLATVDPDDDAVRGPLAGGLVDTLNDAKQEDDLDRRDTLLDELRQLHSVREPLAGAMNLSELYGEKEISLILKRATELTELQHDEPPIPSADSMTLQELEHIAAEAGIDPAYLRQAAFEVDAGPHVVAADFVLAKEITVPGELREDGFERIVEVIERGTSEHGQSSVLRQTLKWRAEATDKDRPIQITVTSRDGQTSVRLEEYLKRLANFGYMGGRTIVANRRVVMGRLFDSVLAEVNACLGEKALPSGDGPTRRET